jgi:hypothetical protein
MTPRNFHPLVPLVRPDIRFVRGEWLALAWRFGLDACTEISLSMGSPSASAFDSMATSLVLLAGVRGHTKTRSKGGCCCADLGCGAVAVRIRRTGSVVVWSDFGGELADLGPFEFDWTDYESAVRGAHGIGGFEPGASVCAHVASVSAPVQAAVLAGLRHRGSGPSFAARSVERVRARRWARRSRSFLDACGAARRALTQHVVTLLDLGDLGLCGREAFGQIDLRHALQQAQLGQRHLGQHGLGGGLVPCTTFVKYERALLRNETDIQSEFCLEDIV